MTRVQVNFPGSIVVDGFAHQLVRGHALYLPFVDGTFQSIITSPPYWGLRSYGDDGREIGREALEVYLKQFRVIAAELWRVTDDEAVLWVNHGDTASGSGGAGGDYNTGGSKVGLGKYRQGDSGLAPMQWCNVPARVAMALCDEGWRLRAEVIWDKGQVRPERIEHVRRPLVAKESIFMFAKGRKYRFYPERMVERGDVWHFPPVKGPRRGVAPFPDELVRRCLVASTEPDDLVLDPFVGSGTTVRVAVTEGRRAVGVDLYAGMERT